MRTKYPQFAIKNVNNNHTALMRDLFINDRNLLSFRHGSEGLLFTELAMLLRLPVPASSPFLAASAMLPFRCLWD